MEEPVEVLEVKENVAEDKNSDIEEVFEVSSNNDSGEKKFK